MLVNKIKKDKEAIKLSGPQQLVQSDITSSMLRNKLHVYGDPHGLTLPVNGNYGQHMLHRFMMYRDDIAYVNATTKESLTYGEVAQLTVDIALSLSRMGVGKGQVVGICSEERIHYIPTVLGIICAGAAYTAVDSSGQSSILHRLQITKPTVIFCCPDAYTAQKDLLRAVGTIKAFIVYGDEERQGATLFKDFTTEHADVEDFLPAPVDVWTDVSMILYSSGTTGLPKAVPLTHMNNLVRTAIFIEGSYYTGKTVQTAPQFLEYNFACLYAGATVIFSPKDLLNEILEAIQQYKVRILQQMPPVLLEMVKSPILEQYDLSSLEYVYSASSPLDSKLIETVKSRIPSLRNVYQMYGMSETGPLSRDEGLSGDIKPGSVGRALPGVIIKVVDQSSRESLDKNQHGEICVKSPALFPGYWGIIYEDYLDDEGFFKTGDIGYYDEDKYFYIVERIKDMIKYHGYSVSAAEMDAVLLAHPAVREAGVVGAPHAISGELPTAFVVLQPGAAVSEEELRAYVDEQVLRTRVRCEQPVQRVLS